MTFEEPVDKFGFLLDIDPETLVRWQVDKGRVKVGYRVEEEILSAMMIVVGELTFQLWVEVEKPTARRTIPCMQLVFKRLFTDLGILEVEDVGAVAAQAAPLRDSDPTRISSSAWPDVTWLRNGGGAGR